jgi:hypothetical protein
MKPIAFGQANCRLLNIAFSASESYRESAVPDIPIVTEDRAFVSLWRPSPSERLRLAVGAPVRVLVNYSLHGPLHVDTERGWGTSSLSAD